MIRYGKYIVMTRMKMVFEKINAIAVMGKDP